MLWGRGGTRLFLIICVASWLQLCFWSWCYFFYHSALLQWLKKILFWLPCSLSLFFRLSKFVYIFIIIIIIRHNYCLIIRHLRGRKRIWIDGIKPLRFQGRRKHCGNAGLNSTFFLNRFDQFCSAHVNKWTLDVSKIFLENNRNRSGASFHNWIESIIAW